MVQYCVQYQVDIWFNILFNIIFNIWFNIRFNIQLMSSTLFRPYSFLGCHHFWEWVKKIGGGNFGGSKYCFWGLECNFFLLILSSSVAELSSVFHYLSWFLAAAYKLLSSSSSTSMTSSTMKHSLFWPIRDLENVTWQTYRKTDIYTFWHYDDQCPPGSGRKNFGKFWIQIFYPTPPLRGVLKKWKF